MKKIIIGFIGKLSAGKGTACAYLKEKHKAQVLMFSRILRDILDRLYLPQSRDNMQNLSQSLRETFGQDALAKVIAADAERSEAPMVAIDGIRRPKDMEFLKKSDNFQLVFIEADQKLRYERVLGRGQNAGESQISFEQFKENEKAEAESLIDEVRKEAKFTIANNGTPEELYQQIELILTKIK